MERDTEKNKAKTPTLRVTNLTAGRLGAKSGAPEKSNASSEFNGRATGLRVTNFTAGRVGAKSGAPEKSEGQFGIQWVAHPPTKETTHL
jgi:hypothetical protein